MYDYVIVGAGSAGCVLAARLSEDPDVKVLLLEAGPPDVNENIHVPLGYLQLGATEVDWDYHSAPEAHCDGRRITLPRGRVLGGSSSINAMVYIRGNHLDYDEWGVPGWSWADLLPYFIKAEDNERGASELHGVGGPLPVSESRSHNRIAAAFVEAGVQAGLARNHDFNGGRAGRRRHLPGDPARRHAREHRGRRLPAPGDGAAQPHGDALHAGRTGSCSRARARSASRPPSSARPQEFRAEREVILCGGAYNSPQLLMLSGRRSGRTPADARNRGAARPAGGRREPLRPPGHAARVDDARSPRACCSRSSRRRSRSYEADPDGAVRLEPRRGAAASRASAPGAPAPDIQFHVAPVQIVDEGMRDPEAHGVWVSPCLLTQHSRGTVRLASADPTAKPIIHNDFYTRRATTCSG